MTRFLLLLMLSLSLSCSPAARFRRATGIYYKRFPKGILLTETIALKEDSTFHLHFRTCTWGNLIGGKWRIKNGNLLLNTTIQLHTVLPAVFTESTEEGVCSIMIECDYGSSYDSARVMLNGESESSSEIVTIRSECMREIGVQVFKAGQVVNEQKYTVQDTAARQYIVCTRLVKIEKESIFTNAVWKRRGRKLFPEQLPGGWANTRQKGYRRIVVHESEIN